MLTLDRVAPSRRPKVSLSKPTGTAPPFTPADIDLELWLDASDLATITATGVAVSQLGDKSGKGRNFSQATSTARPSTGTATLNARNVLAFDGNDRLQAASAADWKFLHDGTPYIVVAVWKSGTGTQILVDDHNANVAIAGFSLWRLDTNTAVHMVSNAGGGSIYAVQNIVPAVATASTWHVTSLTADPGNATAANRSLLRYDDGAVQQLNTKTGTPSSAAAFYPLNIGSMAQPAGGLWFTGEFAELIIAKGAAATPENLENLLLYVGEKWGLTVPAPGGGSEPLPTMVLTDGSNGNAPVVASVRETTSVSGQNMLMLIPEELPAATPTTLVLYGHGSGGAYTDVYAQSAHKAVAGALVANGWIVASSAMHGNNWGNQDAIDDLADLITWAQEFYNVVNVVTWGASMGNMAALNGYATDQLNLIGHVGSAAATNLAAFFATSLKAAIKTAYGFTLDADYATATAGYDPNLHSGTEWTGKRLRFYVVSDDATAPEADNSAIVVAAAAATAAEATVVVNGTGGHGSANNYPAALIKAWIASIGGV